MTDVRPPTTQPLILFSLLLVLGGGLGAVGSFWWSARWYDEEGNVAVEPAETPEAGTLPVADSSDYPARPGWKWLWTPVKYRSGGIHSGEAGVLYLGSGQQGPEAFLARREIPSTGRLLTRYEAVVFDGDGNRLESVADVESGNGDGASLRRFQVTVPVEKVKTVGIEVLLPEG